MTIENGQSVREAYLTELRAQIDRLQALVAAVESGGENLPGMPGSTGRALETQVRPDSFFGMTTPGAVRKFLEMMGKGAPQSAQAIAEALVKGGLDKADNLSTVMKNVYTAFKRGKDEDFVKIGKLWGLVEWYPTKPKADEGKPKKPKGKAGKSGPHKVSEPRTKTGWQLFLAEAQKAGKTMKQAGAEWKAHQEATAAR